MKTFSYKKYIHKILMQVIKAFSTFICRIIIKIVHITSYITLRIQAHVLISDVSERTKVLKSP